MKTSATNRKLRTLLTGIKNGQMVPRPEFQRRLVWSNKHKLAFLETVLMGYPFPEIYIAAGEVDPDTGEGSEMLVDGQQRITTLYQYFIGSDDIRLGKQLRPYKELAQEEKLSFLEYEVVVRDLGSKSIEEIKEIFQRINSTKYSLNAMEIHNARYDGELKEYAESLSVNSFFEENKVFGTNEVRRMKDLVFCLTAVISIISSYFNRDSELENFLNQYNDEFDLKEEVDKELEAVFSFIQKMEFTVKDRIWKKADLLTAIVEIHRALYKTKIALDPQKAKPVIEAFYSSVDNPKDGESEDVQRYRKFTSSATNDRGARIARGEAFENLLKTISTTCADGRHSQRTRTRTK